MLCWLVGGLGFLFPKQVAVGWDVVRKIWNLSAPDGPDYPDFRASRERVPKGGSHSPIGEGRREKETDLPRRSSQSRIDKRFVVSRREKATDLPGPPPRRSGPSGRDQPRRSSDTRSAGSSHISLFRPRIIDGDTIRHRRQKIRLSGIDAPERRQPYGTTATRALARQLRRGKVTCRLQGKDRYGRHLGTCYVKGKNVNEWMVRNGHAWSSSWTPRYRRQEELARRERKGVHRSRSAIRPEQWRKRRG